MHSHLGEQRQSWSPPQGHPVGGKPWADRRTLFYKWAVPKPVGTAVGKHRALGSVLCSAPEAVFAVGSLTLLVTYWDRCHQQGRRPLACPCPPDTLSLLS